MLSSLLQGRSEFSFGELRHNNHILLFTHALGLLELLQPFVFGQQHRSALNEAFMAFFQLLQTHGANRMIAPIATKFIKLLHNFALHDASAAGRMLRPHLDILK